MKAYITTRELRQQEADGKLKIKEWVSRRGELLVNVVLWPLNKPKTWGVLPDDSDA